MVKEREFAIRDSAVGSPVATSPGRTALRRPSGVTLAVLALAVAAASWAVVVSRQVFPYTSDNPDEAVYLLQAETLRHGRLFPPAPETHPDAFQPLFTTQRGGQFIPKYSPVHPALLATGRLVSGSYRGSLALVAGGLVIATYLLATEVLRKRGVALLAAVFLAASPLFLVQSATFLPYLSTLLLVELFAWALLRGIRVGLARWFVLAGVPAGTAFFARPYDTLLFGVPLAALLAASDWRCRPVLLRRAALVALGALPLVGGWLAFNHAATGNPLHPPFALDPADTFGFGLRRVVPGEPYFEYTPAVGLEVLRYHLTTTAFWVFGGIPTAGLALLLLFRERTNRAAWALAAVVVTVPAGYFFFWGPSMASILSPGLFLLGPWYYAPLLGPLAILGAGGLARVFTWHRPLGAVALVGMVALSAFVTARALVVNGRSAGDARALHHALEDPPPRSLVFVPGSELLLPVKTARNPTLGGPVLHALDRGPAQNLEVARSFPDRTPYVFAFRRNADDVPVSELTPLHVVAGPSVAVPLAVEAPASGTVLSVEWGGRRLDCSLATSARSLSVVLDPAGARCDGDVEMTDAGVSDLPPDHLFLTLFVESTEAAFRWTAPAEVNDGQVFVAPPPRPDVDLLPGGVRVGTVAVVG